MRKSQIYLIIVLLVVGSVIVFSATFRSGNQQSSTASTQTSTTTTQTSASTTTLTQSQFTSDINSSLACTPTFDLVEIHGYTNLTSNIEEYPKFISLERNRTGYGSGIYGCSVGSSGTQISLTFEYTDTAHPFTVCGNSTAWPKYNIDVDLFLTSTGYDLSKSTWSSSYYNAGNATIYCTTVTST